jgi:hypothetical protein
MFFNKKARPLNPDTHRPTEGNHIRPRMYKTGQDELVLLIDRRTGENKYTPEVYVVITSSLDSPIAHAAVMWYDRQPDGPQPHEELWETGTEVAEDLKDFLEEAGVFDANPWRDDPTGMSQARRARETHAIKDIMLIPDAILGIADEKKFRFAESAEW